MTVENIPASGQLTKGVLSAFSKIAVRDSRCVTGEYLYIQGREDTGLRRSFTARPDSSAGDPFLSDADKQSFVRTREGREGRRVYGRGSFERLDNNGEERRSTGARLRPSLAVVDGRGLTDFTIPRAPAINRRD